MADIQTPQAYNITAAHITQTPGVRGGAPCVAGRGIKVSNVYVWHDLMGMSPDQIAEQHDLSLVQVHAALTYAYEHIAEIRQAIHEEDEFVESLFKANPSKLPRRLIDDDDKN